MTAATNPQFHAPQWQQCGEGGGGVGVGVIFKIIRLAIGATEKKGAVLRKPVTEILSRLDAQCTLLSHRLMFLVDDARCVQVFAFVDIPNVVYEWSHCFLPLRSAVPLMRIAPRQCLM